MVKLIKMIKSFLLFSLFFSFGFIRGLLKNNF